jgi:hypothetical protein
MYQFKDDELKNFTDAFNLLDKLTIQGIQNVNILGNSVALFQKFFNNIQKINEPIVVDKKGG